MVLIFLGDFIYDARVLNMILSLSGSVQNIHLIYVTNKETKDHLSFSALSLHPISAPSKGISKYYIFHKKIKKILSSITFDTIIACDLFSLSAIAKYYKYKTILFDSREIYSQLSAHNHRPFYKLFWTIYEKYYCTIYF